MQRGRLTGFALVLMTGSAAWGEETLIIAPRAVEATTKRASKDELTAQVRILGGDLARQEERYQALRVVSRSMGRAGDELVNRLDAGRFDDWTVRRGALRGIQALGVTGPRVSSAMAWAATRDPEPKVREEAVSVIRTRGDRKAGWLISRHLVDAFDRQGAVRDADVHNKAVHALRSIGDRRTAEVLAAYVFAEIRTGVVRNMGMRTQHIRTPTPIRGGGVASVDLPVEMPELDEMKFKGTVVVPALGALRSLTGQDFGTNREQWMRWLRTHPPADWK